MLPFPICQCVRVSFVRWKLDFTTTHGRFNGVSSKFYESRALNVTWHLRTWLKFSIFIKLTTTKVLTMERSEYLFSRLKLTRLDQYSCSTTTMCFENATSSLVYEHYLKYLEKTEKLQRKAWVENTVFGGFNISVYVWAATRVFFDWSVRITSHPLFHYFNFVNGSYS